MSAEISAEGFDKWFRTAAAGERIIYYRGVLTTTRHGNWEFVHKDAAARAWNMAVTTGLLDLIQKKIGDMDYQYIAVKRKEQQIVHPRTMVSHRF